MSAKSENLTSQQKCKNRFCLVFQCLQMLFLHICCDVKFSDLANMFLYLKWLFQKMLVYFMFGALLNIPIYVWEADLEL